MKLLLDDNLPHQIRLEIPSHECITVAYMGWSGKENGELLGLAAEHGFEALITKDANLQYEQNLANLSLAVVIIRAESNAIEDIRPLIPALLDVLENLPPKQISFVE